MLYSELIQSIHPLDRSLEKEARYKIDRKTKPIGSLGLLEELAVQFSLVQNTLKPAISGKALFVFAGDHGVTAEGVSAYPAEVTPQMVLNFLRGGAAINVFCRQDGIDLTVADIGVNYDFENIPGLIHKKVRKGTRNFLREDALQKEEAIASLEAGAATLMESFKQKPFSVCGLGEMGIGNTASASAIISAATGLTAGETTGHGTGLDEAGLKKKVEIINSALAARKAISSDGLDILTKLGGLEIGAIAGAVLAAASIKVPVILDGLISTAGGLIAYLIKPEVKDYLIAGHRSVEIGQKAALEKMGLRPLLDLGLRLGEGTGAALSMRFADSACRMICEMASFDEAGVSENN